ncbi:hypothetical protein [Actinomadura pelletieri]|uniref:hypothetical protein n=1 Tax=Actinomadura pelletieri TaxID=111805 RepID=UPI0011C3FE1E|nr:hypothetical protein [Actinomadura pelletieri]
MDGGVLAGLGELDWENTGFALAAGYDEKTDRFSDLHVPHLHGSRWQVTDGTLLVRADLALAQYEADKAEARVAEREKQKGTTPGGGEGTSTVARVPGTGTDSTPPPPPGPTNVRFFGVAKLNPELPQKSFTKIYTELIQHLSAVDGTELEITLEISAKNAEGFPKDKIRIVSENAKVLKFDPFGFEDQ